MTNCVFKGFTFSKLIARPKGLATTLLALFGLLGGSSTGLLALAFVDGSFTGGFVVGASFTSGSVVGASAGGGSVVGASAKAFAGTTGGSFSILAS